MLFDLCLFKHFSPVANFVDQSLLINNHMILPVIAGKTINVPKKHTNTAKIHIQIRFTIAHVLILVSADWPGLTVA